MPKRAGRKLDICLVNMPFCRPTGPTLAPGLLQAILKEGGFSAATLYANVAFFDQVTYGEEVWANACSREQALPDWIFAGAAFPDHEPDHDAYLELVRQRNRIYQAMDDKTFREKAWSLRDRATRFVQDMAQRVLDLEPAMVGCSSTFTQHIASLALLRAIKELAPQMVTLLGGANCEAAMGLATHRCFPWVDYVVSGEADDLICDLVGGILERGLDLDPASQPEGVITPGHRDSGYPPLQGGGPRAMTADLGHLPPPDYDDYFAELKRVPKLAAALSPGLLVESSRGCWWGRCRFCSLDGRKCGFRSKPPQKMLDELESLEQKHGVDRFLFTDSLMDREYFDQLLPLLAQRPQPYRLFIEIKSNLKGSQLEALARAGFTYLQPGIESLQSDHLALMNKGVQAWQNLQVIKTCRQVGIGCVYNLLYDLPGEEDSWLEEMSRLIPLLTHLRPPGTMCRIRFDRLSYYASHAPELGLRLMPPPAIRAIIPVGEEDLMDLVYSFADQDRETIDSSPFLAGIFQRPAVGELLRSIRGWHRAQATPQGRAMLSLRPQEAGCLVTDTRPMAGEPSRQLDQVQTGLLLACQDAPRSEALAQEMARQGRDPAQWEPALAALLAWGYLVLVDDHLVCLVLSEPVPPEPPWEAFGGGSLDLKMLKNWQTKSRESA